jgi:hypothetical protein
VPDYAAVNKEANLAGAQQLNFVTGKMRWISAILSAQRLNRVILGSRRPFEECLLLPQERKSHLGLPRLIQFGRDAPSDAPLNLWRWDFSCLLRALKPSLFQ